MQSKRSSFLFKICAVFLCCKFANTIGPTNVLLLWLQPCPTYCSNVGRMHQGAAQRNIQISDFTPRAKILLSCENVMNFSRRKDFTKLANLLLVTCTAPHRQVVQGRWSGLQCHCQPLKNPWKLMTEREWNKINCLIAVFFAWSYQLYRSSRPSTYYGISWV